MNLQSRDGVVEIDQAEGTYRCISPETGGRARRKSGESLVSVVPPPYDERENLPLVSEELWDGPGSAEGGAANVIEP